MPLKLSQDCIIKWRLEELDQLIVDFNNHVANAINNAKIEFNTNYTNIVINIAGKSLLVMREILFLAAAGYPEGSLSLGRNLYEQLIILQFFEIKKAHKDFHFIVSDYYLDYKRRNQRNQISEFLSNNDIDKTVDIKSELEKSAHSKISGDYWWTGKPSFHKLVEYVMSNKMDESFRGFLCELHIAYKHACTSLHASCLGNMYRLKDDFEYNMVDVLPTDESHNIPLFFATSSLIGIVGITCKTLELSHDPFLGKLNDFALFYMKNNTRSKKND